MATRALLELGVFKFIVEKERTTSQELADVTKAEKILLGMARTPLTPKASLMSFENVCSVLLLRQDMWWSWTNRLMDRTH
jgi:hypothetical protein